MNKYIVFLGMALIAGCYSPVLEAAPFCAEAQGLPKECNYYDATECRKRAAQLNGVCTANPAELQLQPGTGKYCLVDSSRISMCRYADRTTCENDAARQGAVCIEFPSRDVQPNPYRLDPNSKY